MQSRVSKKTFVKKILTHTSHFSLTVHHLHPGVDTHLQKLQANQPLTIEQLTPDWSSMKEFHKLDADLEKKKKKKRF